MLASISRPLQYQLRCHLKKGGIVAYPTESCFGLGVNPKHRQALKRLLCLKKRSNRKGLIVIGNTLQSFSPFILPLTLKEAAFLQDHWPSATTYLLPVKKTVFPNLRGVGHHQIALRIPDHLLARALAQAVGGTLVSTSANRSQQKSCTTLRETTRQFKHKALIIAGQVGPYYHSSQIIDLKTRVRWR